MLEREEEDWQTSNDLTRCGPPPYAPGQTTEQAREIVPCRTPGATPSGSASDMDLGPQLARGWAEETINAVMPHDGSRLVSVGSVATNRGSRDETQIPLFSAVSPGSVVQQERQEPIWGRNLLVVNPWGKISSGSGASRGTYKGERPPRPFKSEGREASSVFAQFNP